MLTSMYTFTNLLIHLNRCKHLLKQIYSNLHTCPWTGTHISLTLVRACIHAHTDLFSDVVMLRGLLTLVDMLIHTHTHSFTHSNNLNQVDYTHEVLTHSLNCPNMLINTVIQYLLTCINTLIHLLMCMYILVFMLTHTHIVTYKHRHALKFTHTHRHSHI